MPTLPAEYFRNRHVIDHPPDRIKRKGMVCGDSRVISASTDGIYFARSAQFSQFFEQGHCQNAGNGVPDFAGGQITAAGA
jgi:hypothetical protein